MYDDVAEEVASVIREQLDKLGYGVPYDDGDTFYVSDVGSGNILAEVIVRPYEDES